MTRAPSRARTQELVREESLASGFPFLVVCFFTVFTFLNVPNRDEALAAVRPTVILIGLLMVLLFTQGEAVRQRLAAVPGTRWIKWLLLYILLSLPLVEFPGSVLNKNFEIFAKSAIFFFVVIAFVDTEKRLERFVTVFIGCEIVRALEPLYLHETIGYWGEKTYLGDGENMERLAGAPSDIIGANGLAFVCVTALPFMHFWATCRGAPRWRKLFYAATGPLLLYVLVLTASRSGMLAAGIVVLSLVYYSKRKGVWAAIILAGIAFAIPRLDVNQVDRYASIVDSNARQAGTARGRIDGFVSNLNVWSNRPLFGYGLGTSQEANFNVAGETHYAHNLYFETMIELGIFGLVILLGYLRSVWKTTQAVIQAVKAVGDNLPEANILLWLPRAVLVWSLMCALFSIFSYGLSETQWYLVGGLAMVCYRLLRIRKQQQEPTPEPATPGRRLRPGARPPGSVPNPWGRPARRPRGFYPAPSRRPTAPPEAPLLPAE